MMTTIMIVDDSLFMRNHLSKLLAKNGYDIVLAEDGEQAVTTYRRIKPNAVLMDITMPRKDGLQALTEIRELDLRAKVIMLTIYDDEKYVAEAIEAGAKGYVLKKVSREELIKVIHHVMGDRSFLDPTLTDKLFDYVKRRGKRHGETGKSRLTGRELEVLQGIVAGNTDRGIADSLCISEHTVRSHIKSLYKKLGVSSKSQAVVKAMEEGIINRHA